MATAVPVSPCQNLQWWVCQILAQDARQTVPSLLGEPLAITVLQSLKETVDWNLILTLLNHYIAQDTL